MVKVHSIRESRRPGPTVTWVPVTDTDGRVRLEMRWSVGTGRRSQAA